MPGQVHDLAGAEALLKDTPTQAVIAAKAYDVQQRGVDACSAKAKAWSARRAQSANSHANSAAACTKQTS